MENKAFFVFAPPPRGPRRAGTGGAKYYHCRGQWSGGKKKASLEFAHHGTCPWAIYRHKGTGDLFAIESDEDENVLSTSGPLLVKDMNPEELDYDNY